LNSFRSQQTIRKQKRKRSNNSNKNTFNAYICV